MELLHLTYYIYHCSPQENDIEEFINLFNNSEKKKRIGIVFIYIYIHTIINILEINQKKKNLLKEIHLISWIEFMLFFIRLALIVMDTNFI